MAEDEMRRTKGRIVAKNLDVCVLKKKPQGGRNQAADNQGCEIREANV